MRLGYVAAVRRVRKALAAFDASGTPMDPGPDIYRPYPWTREHVQAALEAAAAFAELLDARQTWDGHRREWRPSH